MWLFEYPISTYVRGEDVDIQQVDTHWPVCMKTRQLTNTLTDTYVGMFNVGVRGIHGSCGHLCSGSA